MTTQRKQSGGGRGFASMDKDQQRELSAKGGHASHGGNSQGGTRGGSSEQHAKAGRQSHKNS